MQPLKVPGTLASLKLIREYVSEACALASLDKRVGYRLRLGVDEIATNIINYGYDGSQISGDIEVSAHVNDESLTIILEDTAVPFDPLLHPTPDNLDAPLEYRGIGGLGVYLAIQGTDQFLYERIDNRNRNIFVVKRSDPTPPVTTAPVP
ncbi:MAG: ATP-binding protein [Anaerolineae bacterium]